MSENSTTYLTKKVNEFKEAQKRASNDMEVFNSGFAEQVTTELAQDISETLQNNKNYFYETIAELDKEEDDKLKEEETEEVEETVSETKPEPDSDETTQNVEITSEPANKINVADETTVEEPKSKITLFFDKLFRII